MYKPNELKQDTIGVYKRFPKLSTYKKNVEKWSLDITSDIERLERCANGEDFRFSYMSVEMCKKLNMAYQEDQYCWTSMAHDLQRYSLNLIYQSYAQCFKKCVAWEDTFRKVITYRYWAIRTYFLFCEEALIEYHKGIRAQRLRNGLRDIGSLLGFCLAQGWLEFARELRNLINFSLENDMINSGNDTFGRRRTQHFLVRLLNAYDGVEDVQKSLGIKCAYDVHLLNELVAKWDMECNQEFINMIYALCDRHTHQCRHDSFNNNRYYDFNNIDLEYYFPLEVLSIFYLRKTRGLEIPVINHPIMTSGLERISQTSQPVIDEFLTNLLNFARKSCSRI